MTEFVSIPASMFWVMVGFIVVLLAFNAYFIHKWDISIQESDRLKNIIDENEKQFLEENDIWSTW